MSYRLAKWLFPKLRPDQSLKRLNLIILFTLFTAVTVAIMVTMILMQYNHMGK